MLKMIKTQNPDKIYPSNLGQKWTVEEENTLLEELSKNIDIEIIAKNHNRTEGGINARRREIAYKMYINNVTYDEIIEKTKLNYESIKQTIDKRNQIQKNKEENKEETKEITNEEKPWRNEIKEIKNNINEIKTEIKDLKNDFKDLKSNIKELIEMIKAVYEFEEN